MEIQFLKDFNKTAVIFGLEKITYSEVLNKIFTFSELFKQYSAERISIFSENRPEWIYTIYSAWSLNIIPVIFDITLEREEIIFILNQSKPDIIFCSSSFRERLNEINTRLKYKPVILEFEDQISHSHAPLNEIKITASDDTALIVYTSGTSNQPKGVMLSYINILSNLEAAGLFINPDDSALVLLPLYHIFPLLWSVILPLYSGAACVFAGVHNPAEILKIINEHEISGIIGVPKLYHKIHERIMEKINEKFARRLLFKAAAKINSKTISKMLFRKIHKQFGGNLRGLICGGAALDINVERDFRTLGFDLYSGYGMTEASPMISFNKPGCSKTGSVGKPLQCCTVKIVNGEILVKGSNIMKGYLDDSTATENSLFNDWLHTGDQGYLDEDGFLFIEGRKDEVIILPNGKKVAPEVIEEKLNKLSPLIKETAVILKENKLTALISSDASGTNNTEENDRLIRTAINEKYNTSAAPHKRIIKILITDKPLPRTSLEKLKRYKLAHTADLISRNNNPDIGIDSLDKVVLQSYIESQFGILISQETIQQFSTLKDLSDYIRELKDEQGITKLWKEFLKDLANVKIPSTSIVVDIVYTALKTFFAFYVKLRAEGLSNIPSSPVIFAANHQCIFDPMFIGISGNKKFFRNIYYFAGSKHFNVKWRKQIAPVSNIIVINNADHKSSIQQVAACLKMNKNVIIFPEGTRSSDGNIAEFKKLFAVLSCELQVPVVPVVIKGSLDFLPKGASFPRPFKQVNIRFLEPILPEGKDHEDLFNLIYNKIKSEYENN